MRIFIDAPSDGSVGIPASESIVTTDVVINDKEDREFIRKQIMDCFTELYDQDNLTVMFEDECAECGAIKERQLAWCPRDACESSFKSYAESEREIKAQAKGI